MSIANYSRSSHIWNGWDQHYFRYVKLSLWFLTRLKLFSRLLHQVMCQPMTSWQIFTLLDCPLVHCKLLEYSCFYITYKSEPGYSLIHRDCNRHGGGVAIYISNSLPFNTFQTLNSKIELLFVEFSINPLGAMCIYICTHTPTTHRDSQTEIHNIVSGRTWSVSSTWAYGFSDDLTWSCHIESVCCRARRQLGFIHRLFCPHSDAGTILTLYRTHVLNSSSAGKLFQI